MLESYFEDGRSFYKTEYWRRLARKCKERDGNRCRRCSAQAETADEKRSLHAHHIISRRPVAYPTALDQLSNLETLCGHCHELEHGRSIGFNTSKKSAPPKMFRAHSGRIFRRI